MAEGFGEICYEVPVGFKHISSKMEETNSIIGGESSGGLTVRGHILGKDGVYASTLLTEMVSVIGKPLSERLDEIHHKYGKFFMCEFDKSITQEYKEKLKNILFERREIPSFNIEVERISYLDGCKVYFKNGGWVICRFFGTEPVIKIFCEMGTIEDAKRVNKIFQEFLGV